MVAPGRRWAAALDLAAEQFGPDKARLPGPRI